jgi:hypothetical protein
VIPQITGYFVRVTHERRRRGSQVQVVQTPRIVHYVALPSVNIPWIVIPFASERLSFTTVKLMFRAPAAFTNG